MASAHAVSGAGTPKTAQQHSSSAQTHISNFDLLNCIEHLPCKKIIRQPHATKKKVESTKGTSG
jgi:hypothetical protein